MPTTNELDMMEMRANPDVFSMYVMHDQTGRTYIAFGNDPVLAARNICRDYVINEDDLGVSQGFIVNNTTARIVDLSFGSCYFKRKEHPDSDDKPQNDY